MPKKLSAAILLPGLLAAACTQERPKTVTVNTSCLSFKAISYAQLPSGVKDDLGNVADSDATVTEIDAHNARWDAVCKK